MGGAYEISIEIIDAEFPAESWKRAYGDSLTRTAVFSGAWDWRWHQHSWGIVFEVAFGDELAYERWRVHPSVRAALDAVPDPVNGLVFHRGWGGTSGMGEPRRPRPFLGSGSAELPIPDDQPPDVWAVALASA